MGHVAKEARLFGKTIPQVTYDLEMKSIYKCNLTGLTVVPYWQPQSSQESHHYCDVSEYCQTAYHWYRPSKELFCKLLGRQPRLIVVVYVCLFWNRVLCVSHSVLNLLQSWRWPWTPNPPDSTAWGLGLQAHTNVLGLSCWSCTHARQAL